jgi:pimeloyl-ACP methyl ester carboxylesterase
VEPPEIRYARSGDVSIAYQVLGEGPVDLVFVSFIGNLIYAWEQPVWTSFCEQLASFSRLILLDKRGTGLSDRPRNQLTLETRMDDVRAVLDATGSERAALLGSTEGGQLCAVFAATYPERTSALILFNTVARFVQTPDYPWGYSEDDWQQRLRAVREGWGTREFFAAHLAEYGPDLVGDEEFFRWFVNYYRLSASPGAAYALYRTMVDTDIREVLPAIRVPTLVLYSRAHRDPARYVAGQIPGAEQVEVAGEGSWIITNESVGNEIERFLTGSQAEAEPDRVLATVLFTDIVSSTERATELGDARWQELRARHDLAGACQVE